MGWQGMSAVKEYVRIQMCSTGGERGQWDGKV